jgi:hypothetical protein
MPVRRDGATTMAGIESAARERTESPTVTAESRCYHRRSSHLLPAGGENRTPASRGLHLT